MLDKDLQKHAGEFARAMRNGHYEQTAEGIFFPKAKVVAHGMYTHDVNGMDEQSDPNLLPDEGLMHMLSVVLYTTSKISQWYLSLYGANYTPLAGLTAASYPATAAEIVSNTEGYTEGTRQLFVPSAPSANAINNAASKASFTIATASSLAVNGAALTSASAKGAITGTLMSATKFATTRTLYNSDVFNLAYSVNLTSS